MKDSTGPPQPRLSTAPPAGLDHPVTTAKLAAQAAGTWSRHAPGDHVRSPPSWNPGGTHDS